MVYLVVFLWRARSMVKPPASSVSPEMAEEGSISGAWTGEQTEPNQAACTQEACAEDTPAVITSNAKLNFLNMMKS